MPDNNYQDRLHGAVQATIASAASLLADKIVSTIELGMDRGFLRAPKDEVYCPTCGQKREGESNES